MPQMARKPFMEITMSQPVKTVKGKSRLRKASLDNHAIEELRVNHYLHFVTTVSRDSPYLAVSAMRSFSAPLSCLLACVSLLSAPAAWADSRVFIIANQPDGY